MSMKWEEVRPEQCICGRDTDPDHKFVCYCFDQPKLPEEQMTSLKRHYLEQQITEMENDNKKMREKLSANEAKITTFKEELNLLGVGHLFSQ